MSLPVARYFPAQEDRINLIDTSFPVHDRVIYKQSGRCRYRFTNFPGSLLHSRAMNEHNLDVTANLNEHRQFFYLNISIDT